LEADDGASSKPASSGKTSEKKTKSSSYEPESAPMDNSSDGEYNPNQRLEEDQCTARVSKGKKPCKSKVLPGFKYCWHHAPLDPQSPYIYCQYTEGKKKKCNVCIPKDKGEKFCLYHRQAAATATAAAAAAGGGGAGGGATIVVAAPITGGSLGGGAPSSATASAAASSEDDEYSAPTSQQQQQTSQDFEPVPAASSSTFRTSADPDEYDDEDDE